jgi:hypothetical protein
MRRLIALMAAAMLIAGCSGSSTTDPYEVLNRAADASYGAVQVNVGLAAKSAGTSVTIDPQALRLIVDHQAGKGAFKLSLPMASLGTDAAALRALGVTGDTLDIEVVFDGQALYANGPVVSAALTALLAQTGQTPGDLSGWLRLGTAAEFAALFGQLAPGGAVPSVEPMASHDAASIKKGLEDAGIVVTYAGSEQRAGKDTDHLTVTVDVTKFRSNPTFNSLTGTQLQQLEDAFSKASVAAELWVDRGNHRIVELDVHVSATDGSSDKADVTVLVSEPSDSSALSAPSTYTDVPIAPIIQSLLQSFGQGLFSP